MKVLLATLELPPAPSGGIGYFYEALAGGLARAGCTVELVTLDPTAQQDDCRPAGGVRILRLAAARLRGPRWRCQDGALDLGDLRRSAALLRAVQRRCAIFRPDVVETHDWAGPLPRNLQPPLLVRLHGAHCVRAAFLGRRPNRALALLERQTIRAADRLAAVSGWIGERTAAAFGLDRATVPTLENGVDCDLFRPPSESAAREAETLLYVGTVRPDKGLRILLETFRVLAAARPRVRLRIAGRLPARGLGAPWLQAAFEGLPADAARRVDFVGLVPHHELPAVYARATVAVFPSTGEAHPLSVLEAMACGCAVAVRAPGGGAESVEPGLSGWVLSGSDPTDLARGLGRLLDDATLRERLGRAAREAALVRFSFGRTVERTLRLYAELAGGRRAA